MKGNRLRIFWLALILIAYGWRVYRLDYQSLWRDEVDAINFAVRDLPQTLGMFLQAAQNGPLYFLSLRPWFYVAGTSEFVLRYPSVMAGVLSVPLLWQVTRRLLPSPDLSGGAQPGERADRELVESTPAPRFPWLTIPLLAAVFMAANPYQVWYAQEGKMYATITFLALLASWFWLAGIFGGGWKPWLAYFLTVSATMYTHLLMVLLIPVHFVWFLLAWPRSRYQLRGYGLALAGLTLPYTPMVWWHWEMLTSPDRLTGFSFTPLDQMVRSLALSHARGFLTTVDSIWLAPVAFLFGAGLLLGITEIGARHDRSRPALAPWRRYALLLAWLVLPVVFIYLVSLRQPVFTERYVIWIGPAVALFMALGLQVVAHSSGRLAMPLVSALLLFLIGFWGYVGWQQKTLVIKYDLRSAVHYVSDQRTPDAVLILQIPHLEWAYRYYTSDYTFDAFQDSDRRLGWWAGGPYTNWGRSTAVEEVAVDTYMRSITDGAGTVWAVLSEVEMWDARRLMDAWLDRHGVLEDQKPFPGVTVRRYRLLDSAP